MIISHTHKFIFICNGKTGTSSIEAALGRYQEGAELEVGVDGLYTAKHVPPSVLRAQLGPAQWEEYFVFVFVRNPWDWFVSQHFWNWRPLPISKRQLVRRPVSTWRAYREREARRAARRNIEVFTEAHVRETYDVLRQYRGIYEADSLFQYHYAYAPGGEKRVDFVGRFEDLARDFQHVTDRIGIDAALPHRNKTRHRDYRSYYTEATATLIEDLYAVDVDTFGYSRIPVAA